MAYLTAYSHSLGQEFHQLVVQFVNLLTQCGDAFRRSVLITDDEQRENIVQDIRCHLLLGITPCLVGIAVALNYQTVETQVHSLLAKWSYQLSPTSHMRGVAEDRQLWNATM